MADEPEGTPDEVQDSSNVETVAPPEDSATGSQVQQVDWDSDDNPYTKRFRDTQAELTRQSQQRAELERALASQDPEVLARYGLEFADDQEVDEDEFVDPQDRRIARLEAQLQERHEREQQADQIRHRNAFIASEIERVTKAANVELGEDDAQFLGDLSVLMANDQGQPDVEAAFKRLRDRDERQKQQWIDTKKSDTPAAGPGAARTVDLDDPEERANWIDRVLGG